jgi:hypothetical protein
MRKWVDRPNWRSNKGSSGQKLIYLGLWGHASKIKLSHALSGPKRF